jgi:hypothetical protein
MDAAALADLIVVAHLGYALFVVGGLIVTWLGVVLRWDWVRRPLFRVPHLVCTLIVPVEALLGTACPLTTWERELRLRAGQQPEDIAFMARLARDLLFYEAPEWVATLCYLAFGLVVMATFVLVPMRRRTGDGAPAG